MKEIYEVKGARLEQVGSAVELDMRTDHSIVPMGVTGARENALHKLPRRAENDIGLRVRRAGPNREFPAIKGTRA